MEIYLYRTKNIYVVYKFIYIVYKFIYVVYKFTGIRTTYFAIPIQTKKSTYYPNKNCN
jgi:hypothetical protein